MRGYVTTRHLLIHARIIVQEFGWRAYLRCLVRCMFAPQTVTFLGCVCAAPAPAKPRRLPAH